MSQNLAGYFSQTVGRRCMTRSAALRRRWSVIQTRPVVFWTNPRCFDCSRPVSRRRCQPVQTPTAGLSLQVSDSCTCMTESWASGRRYRSPSFCGRFVPIRTRHRKYRWTAGGRCLIFSWHEPDGDVSTVTWVHGQRGLWLWVPETVSAVKDGPQKSQRAERCERALATRAFWSGEGATGTITVNQPRCWPSGVF